MTAVQNSNASKAPRPSAPPKAANVAGAAPASPGAAAPATAAAAAAPAKPAKKSYGLYIGIGVLLLVLGAIGVAWEMWRAEMEARNQGKAGEDRLNLAAPGDEWGNLRRDNKSREKKEEVAPPPPAVSSDEEDLLNLKKKKKVVAAPLTPVEKAWRQVKGDFDKLESRNETSAKKYRVKMLALEDKRTSQAEAAFIKEANALDEQLKAELAKPENQ